MIIPLESMSTSNKWDYFAGAEGGFLSENNLYAALFFKVRNKLIEELNKIDLDALYEEAFKDILALSIEATFLGILNPDYRFSRDYQDIIYMKGRTSCSSLKINKELLSNPNFEISIPEYLTSPFNYFRYKLCMGDLSVISFENTIIDPHTLRHIINTDSEEEAYRLFNNYFLFTEEKINVTCSIR